MDRQIRTTKPQETKLFCTRATKLVLLCGAAVFSANSAFAQSSQTTVKAEEVVVTAQKRTENVQSVPITIDAIGARQLQQRQIQTVADLTTIVPGLRSDDVAGMSNISIRGVGTTFTTGAGESSVAVHIDGVYIPQPKAALMGEDDLAQVEILRGPQGTLYGRNSTAGVINFLTASPTAAFTGEGSVRYGNYNDIRVQGYVSGPITDTLRGRIYLTDEHHDGWGKNLTTGQQLLDLNAYGGRVALDWDIAPWWKAELKVGGNRETFAGPLYQPFNANSLVLGLSPPLFSTLTPGDVRSFQHYASSRQLETVTLKNNFKINDKLSLTSISGYVHFQSLYQFDGFAAVVAPPYPVPTAQEPITLVPYTQSDAYSQEFDLKGDSGNLKWLAGLYYFHEDQKNSSLSDFNALGANGIGLVPFPYYSNIVRQSSKRDSISVFLDGTYTLTSRLRLFGGVRGLDEKLSQNLLNIHSFGVVTPGDTPVVSCSGEESVKETAATGRVGAEFDVTSHSMAYGQVSTGYKSGGFSQTQCGNQYRPETVTSVEFGYKSQWLDNRITLNLSAYHYEYKNLELEEATLFGVPIVNIPKSHVWGLDATLLLRATDHLRFDAEATFLDARYDEFKSGDPTFGVPIGTDLAGIPLNKAPGASGTLGASYTVPTTAGDLDLRAETYMTSSYHLREFNLPFTVQRGYTLFNLYATMKLDRDKYEVRAYAKNVGNVRYITGIDGILTGALGSYSPPRTYGVELDAKF